MTLNRFLCVCVAFQLFGCGDGGATSQSDSDILLPEGMTLTGEAGHRQIVFPSSVTLEEMRSLIGTLRTHGAELDVYDELYPSPSDPGAYFNYSQQKALPNHWSMTYGNHGWSGGIYQIDDDTLALQCVDLHRKGKLATLSFEDGTIFSHYEQETDEDNRKMIQELRTLHKDAE